MDILIHTLSGIAIGTVVSSFSNAGFKNKCSIIFFSGFAGALPDLDAISLWSKFDSTIGKFFNLAHSGHDIYFAKFWYSHHAFMHSAFAAIFLSGILGLIRYFLGSRFKNMTFIGLVDSIRKNKLLHIGFVLGFLIHLIEDMPTPGSTWGGVNFFWPSKSYIGGTGDIWWWNNYDVFLIIVCVILVNLLLSFINQFVRFDLKKSTLSVFLIGFIFSVFQIKTRTFDFAYRGYAKHYEAYEAKSKEIQRHILGDNLYDFMVRFDNKLTFYF